MLFFTSFINVTTSHETLLNMQNSLNIFTNKSKIEKSYNCDIWWIKFVQLKLRRLKFYIQVENVKIKNVIKPKINLKSRKHLYCNLRFLRVLKI